LNIPFGVIINQDGIGDEKAEIYCQNENIPILLKIPHSDEIAHLYSKGIPFVKEEDEWQKMFADVFEKIKGLVN